MGFIRKDDSYVSFLGGREGICMIVVAKVRTDPSELIEPDGPCAPYQNCPPQPHPRGYTQIASVFQNERGRSTPLHKPPMVPHRPSGVYSQNSCSATSHKHKVFLLGWRGGDAAENGRFSWTSNHRSLVVCELFGGFFGWWEELLNPSPGKVKLFKT